MPRRRVHRQGTASDFAFVNYKHPDEARDPEVKQAVRRHVMKDIGFARRRNPYRTVIDLEVNALLPYNVQQADKAAHAYSEGDTTPYDVALDSTCCLPRPNPAGIFGVDLTTRDLQLVHFRKQLSALRFGTMPSLTVKDSDCRWRIQLSRLPQHMGPHRTFALDLPLPHSRQCCPLPGPLHRPTGS